MDQLGKNRDARAWLAGRRRRRAAVAIVAAAATTATAFGAAGAASNSGRFSELEVIGHRAGIDWAPENTMAAIKHAIDVRADAVELDVRFTRDGSKAVFHDATMERTTNCTGRIAAKTWKQVQTCDAGSWFHRLFKNEQVPSLNQALRKASRNNMKVYIHVKDVDSAAKARSIMRPVKRYGLHRGSDAAVIFTSNGAALRRIDAAGAIPAHMGKLFTASSGWNSKYRYLIPYNASITSERVRDAQRDGHRVIAVEGHPIGVGRAQKLGLYGFMANELDNALIKLDRLLPPLPTDPITDPLLRTLEEGTRPLGDELEKQADRKIAKELQEARAKARQAEAEGRAKVGLDGA